MTHFIIYINTDDIDQRMEDKKLKQDATIITRNIYAKLKDRLFIFPDIILLDSPMYLCT